VARWPALAAFVVAIFLVVAPARGDSGLEKQQVDSRIGDLQRDVERAQREEGVLTSEIATASSRVGEVQAQVDVEQNRLVRLEARLASERERLERLTQRFEEQTLQLRAFRAEHVRSVARLEERLRQIYMEGTPDTLSFVLGARSFGDLLDNVELLNDIGRQDSRIADRVARAVRTTRKARRDTARTRAALVTVTREIGARVEDQRAARDRLVAIRDELVAANAARERTLARVRADRAEHSEEIDALQAESAALAAQIQAAQAAASSGSSGDRGPAPVASSGSGVSSSGFIFPVSGPVVSGFGLRGGRMHEGIDIIASAGTPVVASASGRVIRADYGRGYGNVVVIDHGNGLSTTYAHNSSLAVGVGAVVSQGTVIAYVGSTGNSSGPHVHLEFRINGTAVDPFRYL
jgi:murein DD-endopeptidase MepM/ murein hydrolase activator NlpD